MSIFSKVAMPRPQSNTFDLSHDRKFSGRIGELMPISVMECIPGDKFNIKSTNLTRFAPLITPIMHKASVYCHYFFVPNRILWSNWEDFISGGEDGESAPTFPTLTGTGMGNVLPSSLADYLGLPTGTTAAGTNYDATLISAIPFAAYNKIYNDYYRDENLITTKLTEVLIDGDNPLIGLTDPLAKRAWQHDYYTSALPWTQRGPEATIPLGGTAPIIYQVDANNSTFLRDNLTGNPIPNFDSSGAAPLETNAGGGFFINNPGLTYVDIDNSADLKADLSGAAASSINELRRAFRLQEWLERNARGGARYIEIIMAHFGVQSSDSRLQRPEFLGGSSTPITISEVLQTSDNSGGADSGPQGNMAGHGVSVGSSDYISYKCEEHGFIMGIMSVMPMTAYQQGVPKLWSKFDKFDYFWPSFANIGEQPIYQQELYHNNVPADDEGIFGYTPRYAEYKYLPSTVHGTFRTSLNFWHMGRIFASTPGLNQDFIECDYEEVKRVFAAPDEEHLYVYLHNEVKATRLMPYFGTPTL
jgi:hypothetical protein